MPTITRKLQTNKSLLELNSQPVIQTTYMYLLKKFVIVGHNTIEECIPEFWLRKKFYYTKQLYIVHRHFGSSIAAFIRVNSTTEGKEK